MLWMLDPGLGYRPKLDGRIFSVLGTRINDYPLEKIKDIRRILFIGDSVVGQGMVDGALKKLYGEKYYEYWNAGVAGYNTVEEVLYYKKFDLNKINPDHVILIFNFNDYSTTPVAFF